MDVDAVLLFPTSSVALFAPIVTVTVPPVTGVTLICQVFRSPLGFETFEIAGMSDEMKAREILTVKAKGPNGVKSFKVQSRIDTPEEMLYYKHGGILPYVLRQLVGK